MWTRLRVEQICELVLHLSGGPFVRDTARTCASLEADSNVGVGDSADVSIANGSAECFFAFRPCMTSGLRPDDLEGVEADEVGGNSNLGVCGFSRTL